MHNVIASARRGGVLALLVAGAGFASIGTVAVLSFKPSASVPKSTNTAQRSLQPGEVAQVLRLAGITPESLAAAGGTVTDCETLFSTGTVYCLQAERLVQFKLAHRNLNLARNHAAHPHDSQPVMQEGQEITVSAAQTALTNTSNAAFQFVTTGLGSEIVGRLAKIKANQHWGLAAPYLTIDRSNQEWLALRGALAAKSFTTKRHVELDAGPTGVLAVANADTTVAQAIENSANRLSAIKAAWRTHEQ